MVVDEAEGVESGGFDAQDEGAEGDGFGAGGADGVEFARGEIAFGSNPETHGSGPAGKIFGGMTAIALEGADERKIEFPGLTEIGAERDWRGHGGQPGLAALFDSLDDDLTPFFGFIFGGIVIEAGDHAFSQERHDRSHAEFGGLLQNGFDDFALGNSEGKSDAKRGRGMEAFLADGKRNEAAIDVIHLTLKFGPGAIEDEDDFTNPETKDIGGVMGLAPFQSERALLALCGRKVKPMHQRNSFFALSKKLLRSGCTFSSHNLANSSSLARWAAFNRAGTSTCTRTRRSPWP